MRWNLALPDFGRLIDSLLRLPSSPRLVPGTGRSLFRGDSPNLSEQRLRRDRASEKLFQKRGSVKFFSEAQQVLAGPGVPLRIAGFKRSQGFLSVLTYVGGKHRT